MKEPKFRALLESHLMPMFEGITLKAREDSHSSALAAYVDPRTHAVRPYSGCEYRIPLFRKQPFTQHERDLFACFMKEVSKLHENTHSRYYLATLDAVPGRVISAHLGWKQQGTSKAEGAIYEAILHFERLAAQTYEGRPIVGAVGITASVTNGPVSLTDLWGDDYSRVMSNGHDTLYVCGSDKKVMNVITLDPQIDPRTKVRTEPTYTPVRFAELAHWASSGINKVAISLNRNGEILVFKDEVLQFAKRRGKWIYFPHDSIITRLGKGVSRSLKEDIYKSCLDASFSRAGACICVVNKGKLPGLNDLLDKDDLFSNATTKKLKTKLLKKTANKPFPKLDRRIRQSLLSIDGATVLDHRGKVLAVGAIVKVAAGSQGGGGRKAAAIALSSLGLGIKVSADGPIVAYRFGKSVLGIGTPLEVVSVPLPATGTTPPPA